MAKGEKEGEGKKAEKFLPLKDSVCVLLLAPCPVVSVSPAVRSLRLLVHCRLLCEGRSWKPADAWQCRHDPSSEPRPHTRALGHLQWGKTLKAHWIKRCYKEVIKRSDFCFFLDGKGPNYDFWIGKIQSLSAVEEVLKWFTQVVLIPLYKNTLFFIFFTSLAHFLDCTYLLSP